MDRTEFRINTDRFKQNFEALSKIGATPEGGVNRPAFSEDHQIARDWFRQAVEQAGLDFREDSAGNHSAVLNFDDPEAPTLLLGSHLDSVPNGGRFDGAAPSCGAVPGRVRMVPDRGGDRRGADGPLRDHPPASPGCSRRTTKRTQIGP